MFSFLILYVRFCGLTHLSGQHAANFNGNRHSIFCLLFHEMFNVRNSVALHLSQGCQDVATVQLTYTVLLP